MVLAPHRELFPLWLERVAVHQDYAWFTVGVLWGWALLLWWRQPEPSVRWSWLPVMAWAGLSTVAVQFMIYDPTFDAFQDRLVPGTTNVFEPAVISVELLGDFLQTLIWVSLGGAWWWQGASGLGRSGWRWVGLALAAGAGAVEFGRPLIGSVLGWLVVGGAAGWLGRAGRGGRGWLIAAVVAMAVSPVGPMAILGGGLQRGEAATPWGLIAALAQIGLAAAACGALGRTIWVQTEAEERAASRREMRVFAGAAAVWLVVGLGIVQRVGVDNRRELQRNRLRTVAAEARVFERALLRPFRGDGLGLVWRAERGSVGGRADGVEPVAPWSPTLAGPAGLALRRKLAEVMTQTPFLDQARILVLRDGWWLELATSRRPRDPGALEVVRRATAEDATRWGKPEPYIEEAEVAEIDEPYFCRAPIVDADGAMLGWLDYQRREFFQSLERKWRAGPLVVVALGLFAGGLIVLQRRSLRDRERAWQRAAVETAANQLKTAFLAKVSHELRTPLQSLLGYSELLERDAGDPTARRRLGRLREHGELLLRLVNDLLDLSAMEAGGLRLVRVPQELGEVVAEAAEDLRPQAEAKGLALRVSISPALRDRWFEADAARVRQIIYNLVGNALKFTDHGEVAVVLTEGVGVRSDGRVRLRLTVTDTGPGIGVAEQASVFDAFARLDTTAEREGAGLGLAMVASLATLMDGRAGVESDGVAGSCFWVEWGLTEVAAPAFRRGDVDSGAPVPLTGRRILVAEDNALVRALFVEVLEDLGAECAVAAEGETAWHLARGGQFEAVVLDLALPGLDGIDVARRLRAPGACPRPLRLVGVSAHAAAEDRARALAAGMDVFLSKPVNLNELVRALGGGEPDPGAGALPEMAGARRRAVGVQLEALFRLDVVPQREAVAEALGRNDGEAVRRRAHYLANSASAVNDRALMEACRALEACARQGDREAMRAAWRAVEDGLSVWSESSRPVGPI